MKLGRRHLWQLAAGILLLLALVIQFRTMGNAASDADDSLVPRRAAENRLVDDEAPARRSDRASAARPSVILSEHQPEQMGDFVLTLVEGHRVTLPVAIKTLMAAYRDACRRSRTQPLAFEFLLPVETDVRISFSIERENFKDVLSRISRLAGYQETIDGLEVSFVPIPENSEVYTRTFRVPPNFAETLKDELRRLGISHGPSIEEILTAAGILRGGGKVTFDPNGSTLTAMLPLAGLERIAARVEQQAVRQIKATARLIHSDASLGDDVKSLAPAELTNLLATLTSKDGVSITTLPSVTMRDQFPGDIVITKPHANGWTGVVWNQEAERVGLSILSRDTVEYRPEGNPQPYAQGTTYGVFADGVPQISLIAERDGEFLYRVLTLEIIDAIGRPVRDGGAPMVGAPVPGKQGFVFSPYNNKVVDVQGIPSGTLVADPSYPMSEKRFFRVP